MFDLSLISKVQDALPKVDAAIKIVVDTVVRMEKEQLRQGELLNKIAEKLEIENV